MRIERIELENFRNYEKKTFQFGELTVIVAPNAAGKSNLLEAVYLLSTGMSFRGSLTEEMIRFGQDLARVNGVVEETSDEIVSLSVILTRGILMGKRTQKRRYLVDGAAKLRSNFAGRLAASVFRPEDMRLVEGSPGRRRNYLDEALAQAHPDYARASFAYEQSLKRRNKILDMIREGEARREQLSFWDQSVVKNGNIVTDYRRQLGEYLSRINTAFGAYEVRYEASTISPERLAEHAEAEIAVGYTLVGPHKDDFSVWSEKRNLMIYGSRGEQRLAVLFLKLGAMQYLEKELKVRPVLLLDDIFSELDEVHRKEVVRMTEGRQTIVTSAEEDALELLPEAKVFRLNCNDS